MSELDISLHPIYTLESLMKMGLCSRMENFDEYTMIRYDFDIEEDSAFAQSDLNNLQKTFKCDRVEVHFYYDDENQKNRVNVELHYIDDLLDICEDNEQ